jgi:hypothetical protein
MITMKLIKPAFIPAITLAAGLSLAACGSAKALAVAPAVTHTTVTAPAAVPTPKPTTAPPKATPAPTRPRPIPTTPAPVKTVYVQAPAPAPAPPTTQADGLPAGAWFPAGYPNVACGPPTAGMNGLNTSYIDDNMPGQIGYVIDYDDPTSSPCNS